MDFSHRHVAFCCLGAALWCAAVNAEQQPGVRAPSGDQHQLRRLFSPTAAELASERTGRVFIYDALDVEQVNTALDTNFERIQHMMFTRTHHPPVSGGGPAEVEDDGCD
jgi:hypothetical protein